MLADLDQVQSLPPELIGYLGLSRQKPLEAYIELDTGGAFDELPPKAADHFKKGLGIFLVGFAHYLLSAMYLDYTNRTMGNSGIPGAHIIQEALEEIGTKLDAQFDLLAPLIKDEGP